MSEVAAAEFRCGACGRRFRWKNELAGRSVRCPCGAAFQCPQQSSPDESYELAPEPAPPHAPSVPAVPPAAPVLNYRNAPPAAHAGDTDAIRNLYMPAWLLAGGVLVEMVATMLRSRGNIPAAVVQVAFEIGLGTAVMLAGMIAAARFRGIQLGPIGTAIFKLAAISVAPAAAVALLEPGLRVIPFGLGSIIGLFGQFVLYFALLGALFDLDESDTWYCVAVIFIAHVAVYFTFLGLGWRHW